ncbi:hypothetical protein H072_921 [Dactylellina haptotyla CBS 200.50]|uniref:Phospholipase D n=1 Tax=Dactylellina haptotyla (strain CBS 200.50) TaxID=1284197 RepID=S8AVT1_DACHA|nr:hypothetical protein H072_921 [Dactylellina haptotyla CBS 200.50]
MKSIFFVSNFILLLNGIRLATAAPSANRWSNDTLGCSEAKQSSLQLRAASKPFYAIAHRVLVKEGVTAAFAHGANAVEIDVDASGDGWYADHDRTFLKGIAPISKTRGDSIKTMFEALAAAKKGGKPVLFVWLDLKNPNECKPTDAKCGFELLRQMVRDILLPADIRVMWGFGSGDAKGPAWDSINKKLDTKESLNVDGDAGDVAKAFNTAGVKSKAQKIMSRGLFWISSKIGTITAELAKASDSGNYGKVFGWVVMTAPWYSRWLNSSPDTQANRLLKEGKVDGVIYGFSSVMYKDDWFCKNTFDAVKGVVASSGTHHIARAEEYPW